MYATMGDQCLVKKLYIKKKNLGQNKLYQIKLSLLHFFTDVTDFDNEQKCT